jgi:hypothetical protein
MKIETIKKIILTEEEKEALDFVITLMYEIIDKVSKTDIIYDISDMIISSMYDFLSWTEEEE